RLQGRGPPPDRGPGRGAEVDLGDGQRRPALHHRHRRQPRRHAGRRSEEVGRAGRPGGGHPVPGLARGAGGHGRPDPRHGQGLMRARSVLYLPASNARAGEKARTLPCDVAVLDLEDAVAPEMKAEARAAAVAAAHEGGFGPRLGVRINGLDTPWGEDDLNALRDAPVDLIVAPKVESAAMVRALSEGMRPGVALWAMIETPRALV